MRFLGIGRYHQLGAMYLALKEAGREGLILFEDACNGKTQDRLREKGFQVVGGSAYGDRLESDRRFGQDTMKRIGLRTALT